MVDGGTAAWGLGPEHCLCSQGRSLQGTEGSGERRTCAPLLALSITYGPVGTSAPIPNVFNIIPKSFCDPVPRTKVGTLQLLYYLGNSLHCVELSLQIDCSCCDYQRSHATQQIGQEVSSSQCSRHYHLYCIHLCVNIAVSMCFRLLLPQPVSC